MYNRMHSWWKGSCLCFASTLSASEFYCYSRYFQDFLYPFQLSLYRFIVLVNLERVIDSFVPSDSNFYYWISFDVWGLAPIHFICGVEYYMYCTNAFSRLTWLFPLKCNYEVSNFFVHLKDKVETYFNWNQKFSYRWRHIL